MKSHLIVGNGGAAISAVRAIRSVNADDEITIISKESCRAYSPVLATYYLSGAIRREDMFICDESFYHRNKVNVLLSRKPAKVNTKLRRVHTDSAEVLNYDDLLIATGSSPIIPIINGVNLPGVFTLYTADDVQMIVSFLEERESVAIIGAGLIGIQALGALVARGKKVLLVEMGDQILPQTLDKHGARILEKRLCQEAVDIHLNERVSSISDKDGKKVISLESGARITADAVILAVGVRPNIDFLHDSGIELSSGVVVDHCCRASADGVYAAGDVAETRDPITSYYAINATWPNAIEQGRVAGLNMADRETLILGSLRFNVSTLFDSPCASLGLIRAKTMKLDEIASEDGNIYRKLFFNEGLVVGAVLLGEIDDAGIIASLIRRNTLFPDLYEALLRRSVFSHSVNEYYWSTLFRLKGK